MKKNFILFKNIFSFLICFIVNLSAINQTHEIKETKNSELVMQNFYKNKQVLVTGGAGFIGSHIVEKLVELGAKVRVIDNLSTGKLENLKQVINKIEFINKTITDFDTCKKVTENIDTIFHLAAYTSVPGSQAEPLNCYNINIQGTVNILEAARINKVKNFVFSSSSAVYGNQDGVCTEDLKCEPTSIYGVTKLIGELYCDQYQKSFGINTVCLRYFNVYGERQVVDGPYAAVYVKFQNALKNNQKITIFGTGLQQRDFVPVSKIVEYNLKAAIRAHSISGEVFNVASGKSVTILNLFENLKKQFPEYSQTVDFLPARSGDIFISCADCTKLEKLDQI